MADPNPGQGMPIQFKKYWLAGAGATAIAWSTPGDFTLQPVTHAQNSAEMLARQAYLARIRELEEALAVVAPTHPLLQTIACA